MAAGTVASDPDRRTADRKCVALASPDCKPLFEPGDLEADDTLWFGTMFPMTGSQAKQFGQMHIDAANLARKEFAQATHAFVGSTASLQVRRIGLVACDDGDLANAARAANHLVDEVGVPAIIGFRRGEEVVNLVGSLLIRRGVISVATLTPSPLITRVPQPTELSRMVWRTTMNVNEAAAASISKARIRRSTST